EAITYGIEIDKPALVSIVWLLALSFVGISWSVYLRSTIGMTFTTGTSCYAQFPSKHRASPTTPRGTQ
ncbi:unnamed protein product, partial [Pylaiella littoralis]